MNAPRTRRLTPAAILALALALPLEPALFGREATAVAQATAEEGAPALAATAPQSRASSLDSLLSAPAMSPEQLERAVLERNPTLAAAAAAVREASARADRAGSLMNPMVDVMVAPRVLGNDEFMAPGYVVDFRQNFPLFGERGLEVNRELKALLDQFRSVALQKYAAGVVGREDALQAEVELAMLDHEAVVLGRDRRIVRARVNALLHRSPEQPLPAPLDSVPVARPGDEGAAAEDLPLNRPDVRGIEAERDAGEAMLALAKRRWLPEITLLARYDAMEHEHEMRPMVGAGLSLPLWLGRTAAGVREASAGLERTTQERLARIDQARFEIEEARARVEETRHEIHIVESGVLPATERALTSIRSGYEANRTDFLALLNAERDLARARLTAHRARAMYRMALADWERAIARDITPEATR